MIRNQLKTDLINQQTDEIKKLIRFTTYHHELNSMDKIYLQFGLPIPKSKKVEDITLNETYILNLIRQIS